MSYWAKTAMDATNKVEHDDVWRLATRAEAYLYLGDLEAAKAGYREAIKMAVAAADRRAIASMYLNASFSCIAMNRGWEPQIEELFNTAANA
jgi:hypothetical protein